MDRVLLIGINAYPDGNALRGCINDVQDLETLIRLSCGIEAADLQVLRDGEATAEAIRLALDWFSEPLEGGPPVRRLLAFSGHGVQFPVLGASGVEAERVDAVCPVDFDWSAERAITAHDFRRYLARIPAGGCVQWISDSCHSGYLERSMGRASKRWRGGPGGFWAGQDAPRITFRAALEDCPHVALIAGCRSNQTSADANFGGRWNGALTRFLVQALLEQGGLGLPLRALVARVDDLLEAAGYDQVPQLVGPPDQTDRRFLDPGPGTCSVG